MKSRLIPPSFYARPGALALTLLLTGLAAGWLNLRVQAAAWHAVPFFGNAGTAAAQPLAAAAPPLAAASRWETLKTPASASRLAPCNEISNGGLNPKATSKSGIAAPSGFFFSEVQNETGTSTESNTLAGASSLAGTNRLADNFTLTAPCELTSVVFYAYQTNAPASPSPFTAYTLRIWDGRPGELGATVVFGDTTTNRLANSVDSKLYRIFNSSVPSPGTTPTTTRKIWANTVTINTTLAAGTYWLDWDSSVGGINHFHPPKTIEGARGAAGDNARQFNVGPQTWEDLVDTGNPTSAADMPQDFPFTINPGIYPATTVSSINRAAATPVCSGTSVSWTVTFAISVSGLTASHFSLVNTGLTGPTITDVSGAGTSWTVTASTGTGGGSLALELNNSSGLTPAVSNAPFTGESYTVDAQPPTANAGADQMICAACAATLAANVPSVGTGSWTVVSGPVLALAQISNPAAPDALFTPAGGPGSYTLRWTITNASCAASTDDVVVTVIAPPSIAQAFSATPPPVNGSASLTITVSNPMVNPASLTGVSFTDAFPTGLVVAAVPNAVSTCGGALTNLSNSPLAAGDNGVKLSGGSVGISPPRTCTITVNVTPTQPGPLVNTISSVSATAGGLNNTPASATLLTDQPPTVTSGPVTRAAGSSVTTLLLANVNDDLTPVTALAATVNSGASATVNGVTISGLAINAMGELKGQVLTACDAANATFTLNITDSANNTIPVMLGVTVPQNPGPTLSYASPQTVEALQPLTIAPTTMPSDNGNVASVVVQSVTPTFSGTLTVNPSSGSVTVSNPLSAGNYNVVIRATDQCGVFTDATFTLTVTCPAIALNPASLPSGQAGLPYVSTLSSAPIGGNYSFAVTAGALPPGLTLANNGSFSGAPTTNGTFNFTATATGFGSCPSSQNYSLVITCPTINLSPASLPNGIGGTAYNQTLSATPSGTTYSFALTGGTLPPGLTLASGGALTGTPSQPGTFTFAVTATGFGTCTSTKVYTVSIACPTITLTAPPLPNATVGVVYNQNVTALPAGVPYSYTVTTGTLPNGLSLKAATGALTGTPTTLGTYTFTVTAKGFGTCEVSQSYTITVICPTISLNSTSLPGMTAGVAYSQTLTVTPAGSYTFSLVTGTLPPGLNLNATTGALSGLATAPGSYNFTVKATAGSCASTRSYSLVVSCPTITLNPTNLPNGNTGTAYSQTLTATPTGSYSFTRTSGTLPPGLSLNTVGTLSGTPTNAGTYSFTVRAQGFGTCTDTRNYTITVTASCPTITLPTSLPSGTVGASYSGDLTSTTPSGSYTFSLLSGTLPTGLALDNLFGALLGTPTAGGTFNFTLQASSSNGCSSTKAYSVTIAGGSFAVLNDFDGDRKSDLVTRDAETGAWTITPSTTGQAETHLLGVAADQAALGDYDGDGRTDLAVFCTAGATLRLRLSNSGLFFERALPELINVAALQPVPADYDGDGRTDAAFWEAEAGIWQIQSSASGKVASYQFGASGGLAVPADYDGDGRADRAVFQPATGVWQVEQSHDGAIVEQQFGQAKDLPLPGDYDGDGRAEIALWRTSEATLLIYQQAAPLQPTRLLLGRASLGDWLLAGDYNGDGKLDVALWRALEGQWYFTSQRAAGTSITGQQ